MRGREGERKGGREREKEEEEEEVRKEGRKRRTHKETDQGRYLGKKEGGGGIGIYATKFKKETENLRTFLKACTSPYTWRKRY